MRDRRLLAAWLAALTLACTKAREPGAPTPLAVTPARATAAAPVRVEIAGSGFDAKVKTDFNDAGGGAGLDAGFAAWLEPCVAGSAVPLSDVALTGRRSLLATVPAGLAAGAYRLVVADPAGRTGALERAYRVISSDVARFDVVVDVAPRAGVAFPVTVTALAADGAVAEGFTGSVTLADAAGALPPRYLGPFVLGRARLKVAIPSQLASDTITVSDGAGHGGASPTFAVSGGPPMAVAFSSAPVTVAAAACSPSVVLALRDGTGQPTVADTAVVVAVQSAPPGLEVFSDAGCTQPTGSLTIPAGGGGASFHFRAAVAGPVAVRALPAALPNAVQTQTVTP